MTKKGRQMKSQFYYYFWAIMAIAVCGGQWYVGTGYRQAAESLSDINMMCVPVSPQWDKDIGKLEGGIRYY